MKLSNTLIFFLSLTFALIASCDPVESYDNENITIMPLGDSRVAGNRPAFESYRYPLWKLFVQDNWGVDFVGSQKDESQYPMEDNEFFDRDHEGTGGARTADILRTVTLLSATSAPDVVLLGIGGNDLSNGDETVLTVFENISMIIDILRSKNPDVIIFLEQIAPGRSDFMNDTRWEAFQDFKNAVESISNNKSQENAEVIVVDMSENWSDHLLADPVHYNDEGASLVAQRYYQSIKEHIIR